MNDPVTETPAQSEVNTKSETYTRTEIDNKIANFAWFEVVAQLPTTDIKTNIIYLLWPVGSAADRYEEFTSAMQMDDVHFERLLKYEDNYFYRKDAFKIANLSDDEYSKFETFTSIKNSYIKTDEIIAYITCCIQKLFYKQFHIF